MSELDMFARLDLADAWAIIGPINRYGPLVSQCRYGGVEMPDGLSRYVEFGKYSDNQAEDLPQHREALDELEAWSERFAAFVRQKGQVEPAAK